MEKAYHCFCFRRQGSF